MKEVFLNGFNDDQIYIIQLIGLDNYLKLCEAFAGESIYIPKMKSKKISERNKKIKEEFNGKNLFLDVEPIVSRYTYNKANLKGRYL